MLSICIPVYNKKIKLLYTDLLSQIKEINNEIEIVIIDDCSEHSYKSYNNKYCTESEYIELKKNIGRSKIRNLFINYTKYQYLLFLDCDSKIIDPKFLKKYIDKLKASQIDVAFGGSVYHTDTPKRKYRLRWEYGTKKENKSFIDRVELGNKSFLTNNFIINRNVLEKVKFNSKLKKYGYEDTLFALELQKNNYTITQFDNSVLNNEFDTNEEFINKVIESMDNLKILTESYENKEALFNHIKLLKTYNQIQKNSFKRIFIILFSLFNSILKQILISGYYGNLFVFNIYKLGLLAKTLKK